MIPSFKDHGLTEDCFYRDFTQWTEKLSFIAYLGWFIHGNASWRFGQSFLWHNLSYITYLCSFEKLLNIAASFFARHLFHNSNLTMRNGIFPAYCFITPVKKSGDLSQVDNYRHISILSSIPKILKSLCVNICLLVWEAI